MYLTVNKLNYYVATKENPEKHILKDVSFYVKPGMMCLVLGSPGGGRSSLFKVILRNSRHGERLTIESGLGKCDSEQIESRRASSLQ